MRFDLGFFGKMPRIAVPTIKTGRTKRRESTPPPPPYQPFEESESETTTDKLRRLSHDFSTLTLQKREKIIDRFFKQREELPPPKSEVPYLILMDIAPPGAAPEYYRGEWLACLEFTTRDLSRLMTEGFFWDEGNIVAEEGYFVSEEQELRLYEQQFGFQHARVYNCCSRGGDGPQWTGTIRVSARSLGVLSEFEIGMLSVDLVFRMEASCGSGGSRQRVYQYRVQEEERNFNAWYDGAVLEGWWPWPRSAMSDGE